MYKDRKAVSPVVGVILMVAATIVIATIVMGFLGGFNPPKKPLDIQLANGELIVTNTTNGNWTMIFTIAGADADVLKKDDIQIALMDYNTSNSWTITSTSNNVNITIEGNILKVNAYNQSNIIYPADKVKVTVKYIPTGQLLLDTILIAKRA